MNTDSDHADLRDLVARQSADVARRVAAHPDRAHLSVVTALDVLPAELFGVVEWSWCEGGDLLGRRRDSISTTRYVIAPADGEPDVATLRRWAAEKGVGANLELTDADWQGVAAQVVRLAHRERELNQRRWPVQSLEAAVGGRVLASWVCGVDAHGDLVGHRREDEPTRAQLAEHAAKVAALSPVNRLMHGAPPSPWPVDRPITAAFLESIAATTMLVQTFEARPDWALVLDEIRARVQRP